MENILKDIVKKRRWKIKKEYDNKTFNIDFSTSSLQWEFIWKQSIKCLKIFR